MRAWLFIMLAVLFTAWPARADEPVILLVTHERGPFVRRLRAELESMGFRVVIQRDDRPVPEGAVAVGRLAAGPPPALDIETVGSTPSRQSVVFEGADADSVRMAERVRAAFQPLAPRSVEPIIAPVAPPPAAPAPAPIATPPPKPALTQPPTRVVVPTPDRRVPMGVAVAPALTVDRQHVGMHAAISYYASPIARLRLEPFVLVPLVPTSREGPEGEARLYAGMIGMLVTAVAFESNSFELVLGGGASGVWLRVEGDPAPGYVVHSDDAFAAGIVADVASRIRIHDGFFITPRAYLGVTLPVIHVELSGRRVEDWGLPWFVLALAGEFDWSL